MISSERINKIRVKSDTTIVFTEVLELHPKEMELIKAIRHKWRFGEITILARNGLPYRLRRVQEFLDLEEPGVV